ncbi:MAG TPA: chromate transporter [Hyphomicrobiaceae bacterium]|nr:chromate transporter [Hyphomicrobiaceae bacterium]
MNDEPRPQAQSDLPTVRVSLTEIFLLFFHIGSLSFGGGLVAWVHREVVERRRWLTQAEFLGGLTLAQVLPGINMANMAVYIGQRMRGIGGAVAGLVGLLLVPFFAVIGLVSVYGQFGTSATLQSFMDGLATTAVGLFASVGVKSLRTSATGLVPVAVIAAIVVMVGFLRLPLIPVILGLATVSVAIAWHKGAAGA